MGFGAFGTAISLARGFAAFFFVALDVVRRAAAPVERLMGVAAFRVPARDELARPELLAFVDAGVAFLVGGGAVAFAEGSTALTVEGTVAGPETGTAAVAGAAMPTVATAAAAPAPAAAAAPRVASSLAGGTPRLPVPASVAFGAIFSPNSPWITGFAMHS